MAVYVTAIVQLAPGASVTGQLLVCEKSLVAFCLNAMMACKLPAPLLVIVMVCAALLLPMGWLSLLDGKTSDAGVSCTAGTGPAAAKRMTNAP